MMSGHLLDSHSAFLQYNIRIAWGLTGVYYIRIALWALRAALPKRQGMQAQAQAQPPECRPRPRPSHQNACLVGLVATHISTNLPGGLGGHTHFDQLVESCGALLLRIPLHFAQDRAGRLRGCHR